jgi:hypothetical protein
LKQIVETGTWKWAPILPNSNELFELLDRKIPASLLALVQVSLISPLIAVTPAESTQVASIDRLLRSVANISNISPASALYNQVGSACLDSISRSASKLTGLKAAQFYKNQTIFREILTELNSIYSKVSSSSSYVLPYKLMFHLHELLVQIEGLANSNPSLW